MKTIIDHNLNFLSGEDSNNYMIKNVLATKKGAYTLFPFYGSDLHKIEQRSTTIELMNLIEEAFQNPFNGLGHLTVNKITTELQPNTLKIGIEYYDNKEKLYGVFTTS